MTSRKLIGVMGSGLIGDDPYHEASWSGSSQHFFRECSAQGILQRAFGVEVNEVVRRALMLRNFSADRSLWRRKFYLDTTYYDLLARKIAGGLREGDRGCDVLQIGGIYNLRPLLSPDRRLFSYHDANFAQALRSPEFPREISQRRIARVMQYERDVYDGIDVIFTMSDYLRSTFIESFGVAPDRVKTIGAGINFTAMPQVPADKAYDTKRLLFIGANFQRKGGPQLLQAFQRVRTAHPSARLYLVGPRNLTFPAEVSAGVEYVGFLSKKDPAQMQRLSQILATASLFVMPSLYEPFGIAPLEAMAHGIPAVLTDSWAFPEMVTPGVNGALVKGGDVADLADQLIALLDDPGQLARMGAAGRQIVETRFTWPAVVRRLKAELSAARESPE